MFLLFNYLGLMCLEIMIELVDVWLFWWLSLCGFILVEFCFYDDCMIREVLFGWIVM